MMEHHGTCGYNNGFDIISFMPLTGAFGKLSYWLFCFCKVRCHDNHFRWIRTIQIETGGTAFLKIIYLNNNKQNLTTVPNSLGLLWQKLSILVNAACGKYQMARTILMIVSATILGVIIEIITL